MIRAFDGSLADAQGLLAVEQATFGDCPYSAEQVQAMLQAGHGRQRAWLAIQDGDPLGFVVAFPVGSLQGVWWEIDLLAVHPSWQGRGLGRQLIQAATAAGVAVAGQARAVVATDNDRSTRAFIHAGFRVSPPTCRLLILRLESHLSHLQPDPGVQVHPAASVAEIEDWLVDGRRPPTALPHDPNLTLLLAERNGRPAGYAELIQVQTLLYSGIWIESLAAPRRAAREALVHQAVTRANAAGLDEVSAMVPEQDQPLYHTLLSAGFRSLGDYRWLSARLPLT
jgi:GNAT superfamily N-acetyltransferase